MDISLTLEHLNQYHQKVIERNEIKHFREDIVALIRTSSKKGLFKGITNPSDYIQNLRTQKLNSILPKNQLHDKIDIYEEFIKHPDLNLNINIPSTLIRLSQSPVPFLIQTLKNGKIVSRACPEAEFFNLSKEENNMFCYKVKNKETVVLLSSELAKSIWDSSKEPASIQQFIESRTNPPSITRVIWKEGSKNKYFSIINKKKVQKTQKSDKKIPKNKKGLIKPRAISEISHFEYSKSMLTTSKSVNNPFKLKLNLKFPKLDLNQSHSNPNQSEISGIKQNGIWNDFEKILESDRAKNFLVNSKNPDKCTSIEAKGNFNDIDKMVSQIVGFLNENVFKEIKISAIVLDFIQDKSKKWILLKCRECTFDRHFELNFHRERSQRKLKRRLSNSSIKRYDSFQEEMVVRQESVEIHTTPLDLEESKQDEIQVLYKKKPKPIQLDEVSERDLFERYAKVSEKVDKIASQKINFTPIPPKEPSTPQCFSMNPLISKSKYPFPKRNASDSQNKSKFQESVYHYTQQHMNEVVYSFDEIKISGQLSKIPKENLIKKYGGDEFWKEFILSLYNKVLASDILNKYFKNSKLENFTMIVNGMFTIFNSQVSPEFRRKVRTSHQNMGLIEKEFDCYANIFEHTLTEFEVEENDKHIIMSQIKSMKYLICKQGYY
ncbi:unnamed protein product [Blepharisma stoltei]|uniref:Globin family profile domain-containing protein n=1 Tax=Blepharisma stoltei TaxID=1481888 RepID=A0AAU9J3P5_9CILI|nr:unnamed protein product [Blepharisma stoltei]